MLIVSSLPLQVPVMIYPEPGLTDQDWIPWWIILIAVLAGILLLTLLVCVLWKVTPVLRAPSCILKYQNREYFVIKYV